MISVSEAKTIIKEQVKPRPVSTVSIVQAFGLVLGEDVYGAFDIPAFDQSSMDGYALNFSAHNETLTLKGEMAAGTANNFSIQVNEAARIFTGAPLPVGADTVVMQEKVTIDNGLLRINDMVLQQGSNVRLKGAEIKAGALAMCKGTFLTPAGIGFLAGIGIHEVPVYTLPAITVLLTGNELQEPGKLLAFGQVYESNALMLSAALQQAGIRSIQLSKVKDDLDALKTALDEALRQSDIVLLSGGVSVGDYDFVVEAAGLCGVQTHFHKIKQRPGKPLFSGSKDDKLVFGLPGNPSSSLTCFYEYVLPAIEQMLHKSSSVKAVEAVLTVDYKKVQGLTHFLKGYYEDGLATPLSAQESFRLSSYAESNCLICLDEEKPEYLKGEKVTVHLLPR